MNSKKNKLKAFQVLTLGILFIGLASILVYAGPDGALDKQFGTKGIVFTGASVPANVALQADGKILVAGGGVLERYNSDGSLDSTFGIDGTVSLPSGTATALVLQADGKVVVAVDTVDIIGGVGGDFQLVRYTPGGVLDTSFGSGGYVITSIGSDSSVVNDLAVQSDGKIVAAGKTYEIYYDGFTFVIRALTFALARYNSDGSLDTGFGVNGTVSTDLAAGASDEANALALQADGKIVAAGYARSVSNGLDFALARYNADGTLDSTFGSGGTVTTHLNSGSEKGRDVAVQGDGKILVAGFAGSGTGIDFALVRYNTDGSLDAAFGTNGWVSTDFDNHTDFGHAVGIQSDGKIVLAGNASVTINSHGSRVRRFVVGLVRYNTNGQLDSTFGSSGKVETKIGNSYAYASDLAIQQDGKIVVAGTALLRYLSN
jgi:uncharacterized delta-60 repeat protein